MDFFPNKFLGGTGKFPPFLPGWGYSWLREIGSSPGEIGRLGFPLILPSFFISPSYSLPFLGRNWAFFGTPPFSMWVIPFLVGFLY